MRQPTPFLLIGPHHHPMCLKMPSAAACCMPGAFSASIPTNSLHFALDRRRKGRANGQTDSGDIKREQLNRMANSEEENEEDGKTLSASLPPFN